MSTIYQGTNIIKASGDARQLHSSGSMGRRSAIRENFQTILFIVAQNTART